MGGRTGTGQLFMPEEEKEKEKGKDRLKSPTTTVVGCSAEGAQKAATTFDCAGHAAMAMRGVSQMKLLNGRHIQS